VINAKENIIFMASHMMKSNGKNLNVIKLDYPGIKIPQCATQQDREVKNKLK
jgi:hypothetical protein